MALINRLASHWRHLVSLTGALSVIGTVASYVLVASFAATLFPEPASAQHPFKYCIDIEPGPPGFRSALNDCIVENRVCNEGEIDVYVVYAFKGDYSWDANTSQGWISVKKNECELISYDWSFGLGFMVAGDQSSILLDKGNGEIIYDDGSGWFSSGKTEGNEWANNDNAFVCVPEDFSGPFKTTFKTWDYDAACEKGFIRFPLSNWVTPRERDHETYVALKIKPKMSQARPVTGYQTSESEDGNSSSDITGTEVAIGVAILGVIACTLNDCSQLFDSSDKIHVVEMDRGSRYEGQMRDNRRNGLGVMTWADGTRYEGGWKDGEVHGRGVYVEADGSVFVGEHKDGRIDGRGVYTWANGDKYDGEYKNAKMDGRGVYTEANGNIYDGGWKDDKQDGRGVYTWEEGDQYDGEYKDDKQHGRGVYTWANGSKYDGEWKNDMRNGRGKLTWPSGNKHDGEWKDDKMDGRGVYTLANGDTCEGEWREYKLVGTGEGVQSDVPKTCYPKGTNFTFERP